MTVHTCGKYKTSSVKVTQKNIQRKAPKIYYAHSLYVAAFSYVVTCIHFHLKYTVIVEMPVELP